MLACERATLLRPLLDKLRRGEAVSSDIARASSELNVSARSVWRMLARLDRCDGRASALEPGRRGPKFGSRRLSVELEKLVETTLKERFLVSERPSFLRIVREIQEESRARGFTPPTRRTIKARLDAMDAREVVLLREVPRRQRRNARQRRVGLTWSGRCKWSRSIMFWPM